MRATKHKFKVRIARVDERGTQLASTAPSWPSDSENYDLHPYVKGGPRELVSLRKVAGRYLSTALSRPDMEVDGPGVEAVVEHQGRRFRLCGHLPDLKTNRAGERIRNDMDMILVFREADAKRPAHVALIVQGEHVASVALQP